MADGMFLAWRMASVTVVALVFLMLCPVGAHAKPRAEVFVPRTSGAITVDGVLDEPAWKHAPRLYLARKGRLSPLRPGHARMLWDDTHIYVAFDVHDSDVRARLTDRDAPIWDDGDVIEAFLYVGRPGLRFAELELNAKGALLDIGWPKDDGARADPIAWSWRGIESAVQVRGTLNEARKDAGWRAELALPWAGLPRTEAGAPARPTRVLMARINRDRLADGRWTRELSYWPILPREKFHLTEAYAAVSFVRSQQADDVQEGFQRIVKGDSGVKNVYRSGYRGLAPAWRGRASERANTDQPPLVWQTAPAPADVDGAVTFGFVGVTRGAPGQKDAFELYVDGQYLLTFHPNRTNDGQWSAKHKEATLHFAHRSGKYHPSGYFTLTLPAAMLTPGEPVNLGVAPASADTQCRFHIQGWTDAALMERHHSGAWRTQRGVPSR